MIEMNNTNVTQRKRKEMLKSKKRLRAPLVVSPLRASWWTRGTCFAWLTGHQINMSGRVWCLWGTLVNRRPLA